MQISGSPTLFGVLLTGRSAAWGAAASIVAVLGAAALPWRLAITTGRSMEPTLKNGQPFIFTRIDPHQDPIRRNDVVVFESQGALCVKRVLALGGEHFWAVGRKGDPLPGCRILTVHTSPKEWTRRFPCITAQRIEVPAGSLFVLGDGAFSCDSRHYGPISLDRVVGRASVTESKSDKEYRTVAWSHLPSAPGSRFGGIDRWN
jgi:signal peptidase I